jgi:hypothetical protein
VDLLRHPDGTWLVLEVGTDGLFDPVDRDLGGPASRRELMDRVHASFWLRIETLRAVDGSNGAH